MATIRYGSTANGGKPVWTVPKVITPVDLNGTPPVPPTVPAKATILSFQTPVQVGQTALAVAKITQGKPDRFRWQYMSGAQWITAADNPASDLDHHYLFTKAGKYPIRLQTLVNGAVVDQTGTLRVVEVTVAPQPPEPQPPDPTPPVPGPGQILVRVLETHANQPLAGAKVWAQTAPSVIKLTDANGYAVVTVSAGGVCAEKDGYHSPGVPTQIETCMVIAATVILGLEPFPPPPGKARPGIVRLAGAHGVQDDAGRHYYGGASLFWGPWGYRVDKGKLDRNLDSLAPGQLDWLRSIGHVIDPPEFWGQRANDLTLAGNIDQLGLYMDELYTVRGVRTHLTIFGDVSYTRAIRSQIVDNVIAMLRPRLDRVFCVEIVNEAESLKPTPFPIDEAKQYAQRVKTALPILCFVSSPSTDLCDAQQRIAGDTGTSGIEPHYSRSQGGTKGVWTPVTQPWMGDGRFCSHVGPLIINGEPIGPESSVNRDDDPTRLATMILVGGVGGLCSDCFHAGPGVRGMDDPARNVHADYSAILNLSDILEAERQARLLLNQFPDLQDWTRGSSTDGPFTIQTWPNDAQGIKGTVDRVYSSWSGVNTLSAAVNVRAVTTFTAKKAMHVSVRHARTAMQELKVLDLAAGQSFTLDSSTPGAAIVGTLR